MNDLYVIKEGKKLRCGYTTGSCAAAAAKAAAIGLVSGEMPTVVDIDTPVGKVLKIPTCKAEIGNDGTTCYVIKDAGDDPDITNGIAIYACVTKREDGEIIIEGGEGVGKITKAGHWGEPGEAAINPVPRQMIQKEVAKIMTKGANVLIYVPAGREVAKKTFNSYIGIIEGISIIGSTGIVEPMSEDAFKKSIYLQLDACFKENKHHVVLFPGKYGENVVEKLGLISSGVKVSNFMGDALLYCAHKGFEKVTVAGNIGKLCKLSIGIFNTHSKVADGRVASFIYHLALAKAPYALIEAVNKALTAEEATEIIIKAGFEKVIHSMQKTCEQRILQYIKNPNMKVVVKMYSMKYGMLEKVIK